MPLHRAFALYDYEPTGEGEIAMAENDKMNVYAKEEEWILVKLDGKGTIGYVPANYVEEGEGEVRVLYRLSRRMRAQCVGQAATTPAAEETPVEAPARTVSTPQPVCWHSYVRHLISTHPTWPTEIEYTDALSRPSGTRRCRCVKAKGGSRTNLECVGTRQEREEEEGHTWRWKWLDILRKRI